MHVTSWHQRSRSRSPRIGRSGPRVVARLLWLALVVALAAPACGSERAGTAPVTGGGSSGAAPTTALTTTTRAPRPPGTVTDETFRVRAAPVCAALRRQWSPLEPMQPTGKPDRDAVYVTHLGLDVEQLETAIADLEALAQPADELGRLADMYADARALVAAMEQWSAAIASGDVPAIAAARDSTLTASYALNDSGYGVGLIDCGYLG